MVFKPALAHASWVFDIAGFGEIGEIVWGVSVDLYGGNFTVGIICGGKCPGEKCWDPSATLQVHTCSSYALFYFSIFSVALTVFFFCPFLSFLPE